MKYEEIIVVTNEWIDIIMLYEDKISERNTNKDTGLYEINKDYLDINWTIWGKEHFINYNDIYYNCNNNKFEIFIETETLNDMWNDTCIFDCSTNSVNRKSTNDGGLYYFIKNNKKVDLIIEWFNKGTEIYNQLDYGKIYSNTKFGKNINDVTKKEIKMIAIVFPQFHEIPENNEFWGKGFTEWTLLKKIPRVVNGQIIKQPHDDIGYFNLNDYNHRKYMRILADKYNIYGFCYYHYWFKNKKIMYEPLELMLKDNEPNKPFLFCWANEQWTKRWDGGNNDILLMQDYSDTEGNINHFYYLLDFFKNKNYIKMGNKPIFIFYRIEEDDVNDIRKIIILWNELAKKEGFDGIHFMRFLGPFNNNINLEEIDGYVDFQPGYGASTNYHDIISYDDNSIFENNEYDEDIYLSKNNDIKNLVNLNQLSCGYEHYSNITDKERKFRTSKFYVYNGEKLYDTILNTEKKYYEEHRGLCVNWNNTPRRNYDSKEYSKYPHYYKNITAQLFGDYLLKLLDKILKSKNNTLDFLFISAWNEWNEQAVLEPNNEDGYDYLKNLSDKYLEYYDNPKTKQILNICHKGGGTEKYIEDIKKIYLDYQFIDFDYFDIKKDYSKIYENIDIVHINSILFNNLKDNCIYFLTKYFNKSKKILTIHDYQWFFCDKPNIEQEEFYKMIENKNEIKTVIFEKMLKICDHIIFPSNNIYKNYNKIVNLNEYKDKISVISHFDKIINHNYLVIPKILEEINIAYVGYYVSYKGSNLLLNLSKKYKTYNNYKINYHIYGNINEEEKLSENNMFFYNSYEDKNIIDILHNNNMHGILHLSLFEESYCYALTNSINSGIPILYMDRGVFSERLCDQHKYFSTNLENLDNNFEIFLNYLLNNNNVCNFYKMSKETQINKWYLENY